MTVSAARAPGRGRRSLVGAAALAAVGLACLGVAQARQVHQAEPPLSSAASPSASTPPAPASAPAPTGRATPPAALTMPASMPTLLSIPAIGVRSRLLSLGQNADRTIEVPAVGPRYDDAGWYRYSPTPGAIGPSIIVGHVDSAKSGPSVFFRLGELRAHESISITRTDGSVAVFDVTEVRRYPKAAFPTQLVYGNTDHAALRLLTCGGPFDAATGHFRDNIVVFARLVRGEGSARTS